MELAGKTFDFLSALTAVVVLLYVGVSVWAFATSAVTWEQFSGVVGPIAGLLLGYFVRGVQQ